VIPVTFEIRGNGTRLVVDPGGTTWATAATGTFDGEFVDVLGNRFITAGGTFDWVCRPIGPQNWGSALSFKGNFSVSEV
jgi:hypothetical protein